ncbi:hypothetical protein [Brachybacterium nesterenkovii]|uniref:hypothetical protein n=1 Tax=Brachybacterium nesterenkovii TaxID=47847 RepID=UPI00321BB11F
MRLGPFGRRAGSEDEDGEEALWAALEEQGESVAAGFSWIEDPTFVWVAAGQLLTALGVLPETIRPLGQLRPLLDEVRALEGGGDPDGELIPLAPERVQDMVDRAVPIVVPLLREVLESLRARRIRTELVGLDGEELRRSLDRLEAFYGDGAWRTMDADEIAAQLELLVADPAVEPVAPSVGELRPGAGRASPSSPCSCWPAGRSVPWRPTSAMCGGGPTCRPSPRRSPAQPSSSSACCSRASPMRSASRSVPARIGARIAAASRAGSAAGIRISPR